MERINLDSGNRRRGFNRGQFVLEDLFFPEVDKPRVLNRSGPSKRYVLLQMDWVDDCLRRFFYVHIKYNASLG